MNLMNPSAPTKRKKFWSALWSGGGGGGGGGGGASGPRLLLRRVFAVVAVVVCVLAAVGVVLEGLQMVGLLPHALERHHRHEGALGDMRDAGLYRRRNAFDSGGGGGGGDDGGGGGSGGGGVTARHDDADEDEQDEKARVARVTSRAAGPSGTARPPVVKPAAPAVKLQYQVVDLAAADARALAALGPAPTAGLGGGRAWLILLAASWTICTPLLVLNWQPMTRRATCLALGGGAFTAAVAAEADGGVAGGVCGGGALYHLVASSVSCLLLADYILAEYAFTRSQTGTSVPPTTTAKA